MSALFCFSLASTFAITTSYTPITSGTTFTDDWFYNSITADITDETESWWYKASAGADIARTDFFLGNKIWGWWRNDNNDPANAMIRDFKCSSYSTVYLSYDVYFCIDTNAHVTTITDQYYTRISGSAGSKQITIRYNVNGNHSSWSTLSSGPCGSPVKKATVTDTFVTSSTLTFNIAISKEIRTAVEESNTGHIDYNSQLTAFNNMEIRCEKIVTDSPTKSPTDTTLLPTKSPTDPPTSNPTPAPTPVPTNFPTPSPNFPSKSPTEPTFDPTSYPTTGPTTSAAPTKSPTDAPSTPAPTDYWEPCIDMELYDIGTDKKGSLVIEVEVLSEQLRITLNGPSDRWFGIGFGANTMSNTFAVTVNGESIDITVIQRILDDHLQGQEIPISFLFEATDFASLGRFVSFVRKWKVDEFDDLYNFLLYDFTDFFQGNQCNLPIIWAQGSGLTFAKHQDKGVSTLFSCFCIEGTMNPSGGSIQSSMETTQETPSNTLQPTEAPEMDVFDDDSGYQLTTKIAYIAGLMTTVIFLL